MWVDVFVFDCDGEGSHPWVFFEFFVDFFDEFFPDVDGVWVFWFIEEFAVGEHDLVCSGPCDGEFWADVVGDGNGLLAFEFVVCVCEEVCEPEVAEDFCGVLT